MNKFSATTAGLLIFLHAFTVFAQPEPTLNIATEDGIKTDFSLVVCKDKERLEAVKNLFVKMGAGNDEIKIEKHKDVENLTVTLKGKSNEIVVVGAHYDKTDDGCGVIDNWSGIVILANLYRSMRDFTTDKTYIFVAFGKEEKGLIGSGAMVKAIPKAERINYCEMVNFDSFGLSIPQALSNVSDTPLMNLAKEVSDEMKIPFAKAGIETASSDSQSFRERKIPAITLHGLNDKWEDYLHNSRDKLDNLNPQSVYIGYRHGLNFLAKIESKPCDAFRK